MCKRVKYKYYMNVVHHSNLSLVMLLSAFLLSCSNNFHCVNLVVVPFKIESSSFSLLTCIIVNIVVISNVYIIVFTFLAVVIILVVIIIFITVNCLIIILWTTYVLSKLEEFLLSKIGWFFAWLNSPCSKRGEKVLGSSRDRKASMNWLDGQPIYHYRITPKFRSANVVFG